MTRPQPAPQPARMRQHPHQHEGPLAPRGPRAAPASPTGSPHRTDARYRCGPAEASTPDTQVAAPRGGSGARTSDATPIAQPLRPANSTVTRTWGSSASRWRTYSATASKGSTPPRRRSGADAAWRSHRPAAPGSGGCASARPPDPTSSALAPSPGTNRARAGARRAYGHDPGIRDKPPGQPLRQASLKTADAPPTSARPIAAAEPPTVQHPHVVTPPCDSDRGAVRAP